MAIRIFIFEDDQFSNFFPLTLTRPSYLLLCGIQPLYKKIGNYFRRETIQFLCREILAPVVTQITGISTNQFNWTDDERLLFINGRARITAQFCEDLRLAPSSSIFLNPANPETVVGFVLSGSEAHHQRDLLERLYDSNVLARLVTLFARKETSVECFSYLWELVQANPGEIVADYQALRPLLNPKKMFERCEVDQQAIIYNLDQVYIDQQTRIDAQVVLDARSGPIYIDQRVQIKAQTRVEGPACIGGQTILVGGRIGPGCSFGPMCRIGGEVEQSIFLGYDNKYHAGFLGHAYLGEWINLGALTTNSDLKNSYGTVRVAVSEKLIDTGLRKVGCFIGDYVRTGIGTLLNTGISIGCCTGLFGGGMFTQRAIPPFTWGTREHLEIYDLAKALTTAEQIKKRRQAVFTDVERNLFEVLYDRTKSQREKIPVSSFA